jgi:hypothetical protein
MPVPKTAPNNYYFDRDYLLQYLNQKSAIKVFVDGRYLNIADTSDLEDDLHGIGYDTAGNPKFFDYRSITQIKVGSNLVTMDQLQQKQSAAPTDDSADDVEDTASEPETDDMGSDASSAEEPEPEGGTSPSEEEPEPKEKPTVQKAHYDPYMIGRMIVAESSKIVANHKSAQNSMVCIAESHEYKNSVGIITKVLPTEYEVRLLNSSVGRIFVDKEDVIFL